ncbi:FAD/NAD(P)-binding protein [Sphingobacterium sp. lm-10]|uniref:FAD/NAD(P)-binding protein n=1 Tax=Sphingobacterium sp. lm-10 TaxID=2944904 RepID=UPI0020219921|nr:FAD/NAD(P)-binding protein [Sphingobacterium sp. lm-10]MCL7988608.1 FAD/NAD(P)-binding protein [Sphingobacterium sp. lm-10]
MVKHLPKTIAIVGSGASGVACFIQLVQKHITKGNPFPLSITLFEKRKEFGDGLAFGTEQQGHLLNTKAGLMGIFPKERMHFVQWMHQNSDKIGETYPQVSTHPDSYPPRMLYGNYVQAMLDKYKAWGLKAGIDIQTRPTEAVSADITPENTVMLHTADQRKVAFDYVILATGNPQSATFAKLKSSDNFFCSPWPTSRLLKKIKDKQARVSIVGSSLTAIDALITLVDNGHEGPIQFFSLTGLLPRVQTPSEIPYERKVLTLSNIRSIIREQQRTLRIIDLIRLFRSEVESALERPVDWANEDRINKDQLALLEKDIQEATGEGNIFQTILYSLREDSYSIWRLLPPDQKQLFGKWVKPHFDINRHAIPLENAIKIRNILRSGQLEIIGHTGDIIWSKDRFILKKEDGTQYEADYVINASGPSSDIEKMQDQPILPDLLSKKYIEQHPIAGVLVDLNTMRVWTSARKELSPFYVIGHQLAGSQLDINSLWFNVEQADLLTDDLLLQLGHGYH